MVTYHKVLTIAGSDSSGGAGIQADLKTFSALGCYGMSVITALTAQNTRGVMAIHAVPLDFIEAQITAVFSDIKPDAVKTGMLMSSDIIELIAGLLKKYNPPNIVIDPVMIAQSGDRLIDDNAQEAIKNHLLPLADIVTPNLPEASALLDKNIQNNNEIELAASDLSGFGCKNVLIKGGHAGDSDCIDVLFTTAENRHIFFSEKRVVTKNNHGTGCTLASAIASFLAKGEGVENSVRLAKQYISEAISAGSVYTIGKGHGPVHHFYKYW